MWNERKRQEAEFHDRLRSGCFDQRWSIEAEERLRGRADWMNFKYYSIESRSLNYVREWLKERCNDKDVLDYCCGNGAESFSLAQCGVRKVVGIDISEKSIENCRRQAAAMGLSAIASFEVMDGEAMGFPDNSFDLVTEYGSLHHLDVRKALCELARVVRPNGAIVCTEVLGHNPLIQWYRRSTPQLRTEWEVNHIIRRRDLRIALDYFGKIDAKFFHLVTLGAVPFRKTASFSKILAILEAVDRILLSLPVVRWQAWMIVFVLSRPKKSGIGETNSLAC